MPGVQIPGGFPVPVRTGSMSLRVQSTSSNIRQGYLFRSFRSSPLQSSSPRSNTFEYASGGPGSDTVPAPMTAGSSRSETTLGYRRVIDELDDGIATGCPHLVDISQISMCMRTLDDRPLFPSPTCSGTARYEPLSQPNLSTAFLQD